MKKRILLALFLVLCLTFALCSCGDTEGTESSGEDTVSSQGLKFSLNNDGASYIVVGVEKCEEPHIVIPSELEGKPVARIGERAFSNCTYLTSVVIPESVTSIGEEAFLGCSSLTIHCEAEEKPDGWDNKWNFSNCPVVWNCNDNEVASDEYIYTVIDEIRYGLKNGVATVVRQPSNIRSAIISESITHNSESYRITGIVNEAFYDCASLKSVEIPDSVTIIGESAFYNCNSLTSIVIPEGVTRIGTKAFNKCIALTSIEVSANNKAYMSIDGNLYTKDGKTLVKYAVGKKDTKFVIPEGVISIDGGAFNSCASLTSVMMPEGLTSIGNNAFNSCTSLTSVEIPKSVTNVDFGAFYSCTSLASVVIPKGVTSIGNEAFGDCALLTVYCEVEAKPDGWDSDWNSSNRPVEWGYKG